MTGDVHDGLPLIEADIRKTIGLLRGHDVPRADALGLLTPPPAERRAGSLTDIEIQRIFDEEWPTEGAPR